MQAFKSERAAKMAFTKTENAWKAKQSEGWTARDTIRETMRRDNRMPSAEYEALKAIEDRCKIEAKALFETMREIYEAAKAQGFQLYSFGARWNFGEHTTRDLIRANID